jgi:hypothetical protein
MSEEFEQWWDKNKKYIKKPCTLVEFNATKTGAAAGYRAATETMKAKLDAQSEELAALRRYAKATYKDNAPIAFKYGLYDSNYEPTYILTGEKKLGVSYVMAVKE